MSINIEILSSSSSVITVDNISGNVVIDVPNYSNFITGNVFSPADYIFRSETGIFLSINNTGNFASDQDILNLQNQLNNISKLQVSGSNYLSGAIVLTGLGGLQIGLSGDNIITFSGGASNNVYTNTGSLTGEFVSKTETGNFYPLYNPNNYSTSGNLLNTGANLFSLHQLLSGNIVNTGITLLNKITSLSGDLITSGQNLNNKIDTLSGQVLPINQTGIFYPNYNPNNYCNSGDLATLSLNTYIISGITGLTGFAQTIYLGPNGNDNNHGLNSSNPVATSYAAMSKAGYNGTVIILEGSYTGLRFNLSNAQNFSIKGEPNKYANIFLGEKITGLKLYSETVTGKVWTTQVNTNIPTETSEGRQWIFEWGTPEGFIPRASGHPLHRRKNYRLDHYRLRQSGNIEGVAKTSGSYYYDSSAGRIYLSTATGANVTGKDFWIPSQNNLNCFCISGTNKTNLTVQDISVYFGNNNFNFDYLSSYKAIGCVAFGAGNEGMYGSNMGLGEEILCEYAACANDGGGGQAYTPNVHSRFIVTDAWAHDNGDEGHSLHSNCYGSYHGGLYEYNKGAGITPAIGAGVSITNVYTRANQAGGIALVVDPNVDAYISNWVSDNDSYGLNQWTSGIANVYNSTIINPTSWAFGVISANSVINSYNTYFVNINTYNAGAGTVNYF